MAKQQPKHTDPLNRMKALIAPIRKADKAYYEHDTEIMSNKKYDNLCEDLRQLEAATGITLSNSPSIMVSGKAAGTFRKKRHETPMLSLDKTKDKDVLQKWLEKHGRQLAVLSWKLDGLTVVCTYENGSLTEAVTRGTGGLIGEIVTENAKRFVNLPLTIPYKGKLVIRGEAVITYEDFEAINQKIPEIMDRYKNPRNLASGSVRQLDPDITAKRRVMFLPFELVSGDPGIPTYAKRLDWLAQMGFQPVTYSIVTADTLQSGIDLFDILLKENPIPTDGLVLALNDIAYAATLGATSKYPLSAMAFKWKDETVETTLRRIEWSTSRTGRINPVAVFDPVEIEDTTVERASLHNLTIMDQLQIGEGDHLMVYKANKIIPQVDENLTKSNNWRSTMNCPTCPVCGRPTVEKKSAESSSDTVTLYCENPACPAKAITRLDHMACQNGLDIRGMSESIIETLLDARILSDYASLFHLDDWQDEIAAIPGLGETTAANLANAAKKASHTSPERLLYGLGITGIGHSQSRNIATIYNDPYAWIDLKLKSLSMIDGIGETKAQAFVDWFNDPANIEEFNDLLKELHFQEPIADVGNKPLAGQTYVITGKLVRCPNRNALVAMIEKNGGTVSSSVSAKTTALVNNDLESTSGKNKKAKELNVPVISEAQILERMGINTLSETEFEKLL